MRQKVRAGVVAITTVASLLPTWGAAPASAMTLAQAISGSGTSVTTDTGQLASYREALLAKQSQAIEISNTTIKAVHAQQVAELGYEPGTTDPREIARQIMVNKYSWGDDQFSCYNDIIMRESKWDTYADNPHSSAYGIPQALPGSKMASFGADWRTNPATQIRWGLDYVAQRYGTPCQAWGFKRAHGWY